jgi:alpha-galactosidase
MLRRDFLGNVLSVPALALGIGRTAQPGGNESRAPVTTPAADPVDATPRVAVQGNVVEFENGLIRRSVELGEDGSLKVNGFQNLRTGFDWAARGQPADIYLEMGETAITGFQPGKGFRTVGRHQEKLANGAMELSIEVLQEATKAKFTLYYTVSAGSPIIEHRLTIENQGDAPLPPISRFDPLTLWLRGDQGPLQTYMWGDVDGASDIVTPRLAESTQRRTLDSTLAITGVNGSKPWFILENIEKREFIFVRIGWTVDWGLRVLRDGNQVLLTSGVLKSIHELKPGQRLESPRIWAGLVHGELDDAINVMHDQLRSVLPPTLTDYPWVTYNLWFTEPGDMEDALKKEADFAADLGIECFYHDASWYEGADTRGSGLWGQGLGNYDELKTRFPHGLGALSDYVHRKGMKFGLWVDPPNIESALVDKRIPSKWLAQRDGVDCVIHVDVWKPDPGLKRLCLGCPEVVEYLKKSLSGIIQKWNIDWLKWDPSGNSAFDQPCNRTDHGHQAGNGTYAAVRGQEEIYRFLLENFPNLVIEHVYGPDGFAPFSRNFPVSYDECNRNGTYKIRHVVIGASYWFPGAFGQSFIWDRPDPIVNRPDLKPLGFLLTPHTETYLDNLFRSCMMTGFGFGTLDGSISQAISKWSPETIEAARRNIKALKKYRHLLSADVYHLSPQNPIYVPDRGETPHWDIVEYVKRDGSEAVAFFFRGGAKDSTHKATLKGLKSDAQYGVTNMNTGQKRNVSGRALMEQGLEVSLPDKDNSEIVLIGPL